MGDRVRWTGNTGRKRAGCMERYRHGYKDKEKEAGDTGRTYRERPH